MQISISDSRTAFLIAFDQNAHVDVAQALLTATQEKPEMLPRWCDHDGHLRANLEVFLNGENIRYQEGMATQLNDADELYIISNIAGG